MTGHDTPAEEFENSERIGISKTMLSKIENAWTACSLTTLSRLARGLDVPVNAPFRSMDDEGEAAFVPAGDGARIVPRGTKAGHDYARRGSPGRPQADGRPCWPPLPRTARWGGPCSGSRSSGAARRGAEHRGTEYGGAVETGADDVSAQHTAHSPTISWT
ncbi:helix-turn-helix domain-containing protein [Streptomyces sp. NPDC001107]